ncbi:MAG: 23S rRNA (uracil(1939)-C(5))-methyltransferase RlmD [Christensenellales bacterium]|jgi:23S rRNA (uracil1939-C5)-methyltransferase
MAIPVKKNQDIELQITALGSEGQGIGRYEGYAIFVEGALPGERVLVTVIKAGSSYGVGKLRRILSPSKERVTPKCRHFGRCGGCSLQHMNYQAQLAYKTQLVKDALVRIGGFSDPNVLPAIEMMDPWRYRNKAAFPAANAEGNIEFGLFAARSHRVVPISDCLIQKSEATLAIQAVQQWAKECGLKAYDEITGRGVVRHVIVRTASTGKTMVTVVTTGPLPKPERLVELLQKRIPDLCSLVHNVNKERTNVIAGERYRVIWGEEVLEEKLCDLVFSVSAASFLQVNIAQTEILYEKAIEFANLTGDDVVLDLYCGIGTLSLVAAERAKEVIGIEIVQDAIENARENAKKNGIFNVRFLCGAAENVLPYLIQTEDLKPDAVILDPPRKGCEAPALHAIAKTGTKRIVYVSCNPATLARDCALVKTAGYELVQAQPVDLFPQTAHVECVVLMSRVEK